MDNKIEKSQSYVDGIYIPRDRISHITNCIRQGRPAITCCRSHGITEKEFDHLMTVGKDSQGDNAAHFFQQVTMAEAGVEMDLIDEFRMHTKADWRAADRLLQIMNDQYNPKHRVDVRRTEDVTVKNVVELDAGSLEKMFELMQQVRGAGAIIAGDPIDIIDAEIVDDESIDDNE